MLAPVAALIAAATLALVLAAQLGVPCARPVALMPDMAGMPGMAAMPDMTAAGGLSVCPVVLVVGIAVVVLSAFAAFTLVRARHRSVLHRRLATWLASLSLVRSVAALLLLGSSAVGTMLIADGDAPTSPAAWLLVGLILAVTALALTLVGHALGRIVLAFGRRLIVGLLAVLRYLQRDTASFARIPCPVVARRRIPAIAAGRALRAPPYESRLTR